MADRGDYRAIRRVLLNGPDFRKLPERARFAFVALKVNIGPSGIETIEPDALIATLAAQMGAKTDQVRVALDMLEHQGWIHREENILWIVGQLEHDPHVKLADVKHRRMVQRHVAGLPRLGIVRDYIAAHPSWFEGSESDPTKGLPDPSEGPSLALHRPFGGPSKHKREKETENETEREAPSGGADAPPPRTRVLAHHKQLHPRAKHDAKATKQVDKALGLGFDADELCLALEGAMADPWCVQTGNTGFNHVFRDAESIGKYIAKAGGAGKAGPDHNITDPTRSDYVGVVDGWMSPELERLTRPDGYRPPRSA